jgi:hypothetical protein
VKRRRSSGLPPLVGPRCGFCGAPLATVPIFTRIGGIRMQWVRPLYFCRRAVPWTVVLASVTYGP